jgi:hypothetical protein
MTLQVPFIELTEEVNNQTLAYQCIIKVGMLNDQEQDTWILGNGFLKNYYTVLNDKDKTIGFAESKFSTAIIDTAFPLWFYILTIGGGITLLLTCCCCIRKRREIKKTVENESKEMYNSVITAPWKAMDNYSKLEKRVHDE